MADNPNKKKKDRKQVSQQEHEQRYHKTKNSTGKKLTLLTVQGRGNKSDRSSDM